MNAEAAAHHDSHAHVAHHFDDAEQQYVTAQLGMWAFLATEVMFFGGMFAAYFVYRWLHPAAFHEGSQHLDLVLGTVNTALLLASSFTVALSVHAAQTGSKRTLVWLLVATIVMGTAFLGIKGYEYWHKFHENMVPGVEFELKHPHDPTFANPVEAKQVELFIGLYFAMTGFHALHMVIGVGIFAVVAVQAARDRFGPAYYTPVEISGLYWHFVDLVWVFLYPMLYLIA